MGADRWEPFRSLIALHNLMQREIEGRPRGSAEISPGETFSGTWVPPVDILETPESILVCAELPGFRRDEIDIHVADNVLTVRGERKFQKQSTDDNYLRIERSYGEFSRSFTLPRSVDAVEISASYADGVLSIALPKRQEEKPRRIDIDGKAGGGPIDI